MGVCAAIACGSLAQPEHDPCCSTHGKSLCCDHYNRRHFVAVNKCSPQTHTSTNKEA